MYGLFVIPLRKYVNRNKMAVLTAAAIASLAAAAINGGISLYANRQSQQAMNKYRNALAADRSQAVQKENYLENVDPLHTKTGSTLSTDMANKLKDVNEAAAGRNAVMGGSGHNTAATKDITSQLMSQYQNSLIRAHEMNVVPQLNYYRSRYDRANQGLEKAEYDKSVANINAASTAAQGMINGIAAAGQVMAGSPSDNTANPNNGNGTPTGNVDTTPTNPQPAPTNTGTEPGTPPQYASGNRKVVQLPTGEWIDEISGQIVDQ